MKSKSLIVFGLVLSLFCGVVFAEQEPVRVLIYSGANNHNWKETTPAIKDILTNAGISVDVTEKPEAVTAEILSKYDVIVSNWNNFKDKSLVWSNEAYLAYRSFIHSGGGHVMLHAGGSSLYDWPEYHKIVASWGKKTSHGRIHEFPVTMKSPDHPICVGLKNFTIKDELWRNTKFPEHSKVLMTGFSSKKSGGNDTDEPILAVSNYGRGKCVNFMLGHDTKTMTNPNFKTILVRSVQWAAPNKQSRNLFTVKMPGTLTVLNNGKIVWRFNYDKETSKPFFHPLSLLDGTVLTENRPADHPWHHALWFTWKYINGVNFWEENRKTGKSNGEIDWKFKFIRPKSTGQTSFKLDLTYNIRGQEPILSEERIMLVSLPDEDGVYSIDWTSKFTACSDVDVKLDRTPIPGEKGGKAWGGYAGLSVRLNGKGKEWAVTTEKEPITFEKGTYRGKAKSMEFSGVFDGKPAGIAILDHPENLNSPTPWYSIAGNPMKYYSPAVICYKPHTLKSGESFTLKYRVIVHPKKWDANDLKNEISKYNQSQ